MTAVSMPTAFPVGAYNHGLPYLPARGRYAPHLALEDRLDAPRLKFDLQRQRPSPREFLACVVQEMKVRYYQSSTVRTYRNALAKFLRWCGCTPHRLNREHVRSYLELLVNRGGSHSWIGHNLLAIRTAFDKLCGLSLTLGLEAPRKPKRLPPILSTQEVTHLLQAAPSLRDKLLLGLIYGTGMRASEVGTASLVRPGLPEAFGHRVGGHGPRGSAGPAPGQLRAALAGTSPLDLLTGNRPSSTFPPPASQAPRRPCRSRRSAACGSSLSLGPARPQPT